jgi:predicted TIM-barrel fold metal-dependent hydrolase
MAIPPLPRRQLLNRANLCVKLCVALELARWSPPQTIVGTTVPQLLKKFFQSRFVFSIDKLQNTNLSGG